MAVLTLVLVAIWWTWPSTPNLRSDGTNLTHNALAMAPDLLTANSGSGMSNRATTDNVFSQTGQAAGDQAANVEQANLQSTVLNAILVPTAIPRDSNGVESIPENAIVTMRVDPEAIAAVGLNALSGILKPTSTPASVDATTFGIALPRIQLLPGVQINLPFGQPTPTPTPTPPPTPTPRPVNLTPGRLWSTFTPGPESDHFWVGRAFRNGSAQLASPAYQFGSTAGDRYRTHHGVDISNPSGTPVLAATDGEVIHAGPDDTVLLGPYNNFYGNTVVIRLDRQLSVAGGQLDVFLLYGHLSRVTVNVGQRVRPEDVVGEVGMTGIAIGPHLHVEIRLGANTYFNNVNPYLWMAPLEGQGAVAVRALTADGRTWPGAYISLVRYAGGTAAWARQIITYMDVENISPDPAWGENGAMDGVPAGSYYVVGVINGERVSAEIEVRAGQTTFVELRTRQ